MKTFSDELQRITAKIALKRKLERFTLILCFVLLSMNVSADPEDKKQANAEQEDVAQEASDAEAQQQNTQLPPEPIVVQVTGYAHYEAKAEGVSDPKRLLAIRASRLDAYRNLAERIYGISVSGQSQVRDFVLENDHFSVSLDTVIRGAHVVSISENKKTGIETVLELSLPGDFVECLNKVNSFKTDIACLQPISSNDSKSSNSGSVASLRAPMGQHYYLQ